MRKLIFLLLFIPIIGFSQHHVINPSGVLPSGESSNMLSNGTLDSATDWNFEASWSFVTDHANFGNSGGGALYQNQTDMADSILVSTDYTVGFTVSNSDGNGNNAYFYIRNAAGNINYVAQMTVEDSTYSIDFTTGIDVGGGGIAFDCLNDGAFDIDDITLVER